MRRVTLWLILALILVAGVVAAWLLSQPGVPRSAIPEGATEATVAHVHDGDTLFLDGFDGASETKVRLIGIDSPEIADDDTAQECYGPEATAELRKLLPDGTTVWALHDRETHDQYGRELLYLYTADGVLVNRAMVIAGAAVAIRVGENDRYWTDLQAAELDARTAGAGMWAVC
jgi:micrococcal nuclease